MGAHGNPIGRVKSQIDAPNKSELSISSRILCTRLLRVVNGRGAPRLGKQIYQLTQGLITPGCGEK